MRTCIWRVRWVSFKAKITPVCANFFHDILRHQVVFIGDSPRTIFLNTNHKWQRRGNQQYNTKIRNVKSHQHIYVWVRLTHLKRNPAFTGWPIQLIAELKLLFGQTTGWSDTAWFRKKVAWWWTRSGPWSYAQSQWQKLRGINAVSEIFKNDVNVATKSLLIQKKLDIIRISQFQFCLLQIAPVCLCLLYEKNTFWLILHDKYANNLSFYD